MSEPVALRRPLLSDVDVRMAAGVQPEVRAGYGLETPGGVQPMPYNAALDWLRKLTGYLPHAWVIEAGGQPVGSAYLHKVTAVSARYAVGLFTPALFGRGYGTAATRLVLEYAAGIGLDRVELGVLAVNRRAVHAYYRAGFEVTGRSDDELEMTAFLGDVP